MLLPKPLILKKRHEKRAAQLEAYGRVSPTDADDEEPAALHVAAPHGGHDEEEFDFSEVMVHQARRPSARRAGPRSRRGLRCAAARRDDATTRRGRTTQPSVVCIMRLWRRPGSRWPAARECDRASAPRREVVDMRAAAVHRLSAVHASRGCETAERAGARGGGARCIGCNPRPAAWAANNMVRCAALTAGARGAPDDPHHRVCAGRGVQHGELPAAVGAVAGALAAERRVLRPRAHDRHQVQRGRAGRRCARAPAPLLPAAEPGQVVRQARADARRARARAQRSSCSRWPRWAC